MSITLNATLKTAQDGINHRPIAKIISSPMGEIIPTQGNYFNTLTSPESEPHIISQSTGRLGVVMERNSAIKYLYTPTDRSEWIEVGISTPYALASQDPCVVELANGNIGIIYTTSQTMIYYNVITPTGVAVSGPTLLYDAGTNWVANPYVIRLADDSYLLVYPEGTGVPPSESNTYSLKKRTSGDFASWGSAADITPTAFASVRYCNNPNLVQVTSGRIFLHLDYLTQYTNATELNNIYMMYSDDNGSTWSAAEKITNYTTLGESGTHPTAVEKDDGDLIFMYAEKSLVKMLDANMTGYPYSEIGSGKITFDADNCQIAWHHYGTTGSPTGVTLIDVNAWEWQRTITDVTIPAIYGAFGIIAESFCEWSAFLVAVDYAVQAYNHITEASKIYRWGGTSTERAGVTYLIQKDCGYASMSQEHLVIVERAGQQQLWIYHQCAGYGSYDNSLGWIDLNEIKDPITGLYDYHEEWGHAVPNVTIWSGTLHGSATRWDYNHDYLIFHSWGSTFYESLCYGIGVFSPASGNFIIWLDIDENSGFPRTGARDLAMMGDDIYFSFPYLSDDPDKRGLGHWHADTGIVTYHQPTWATVDDYQLDHFVDMGDGRILMASNNTIANGGGVVIFDTVTESFEIINDDTYPGFGRTGAGWESLAYDPATKTIYALYENTLVAFSEYGPYSTLLQNEVDNVGSTIDHGDQITWSYHTFEYQPNIVLDEDFILWGVWQHLQDGMEYSANWANLLYDIDMTDDISIEDPIQIKWDLEKISQLSISFAKGHLYDPSNLMSTLSPFLRKGRKIVVEFGERIGGTDYWQAQGEFCIKSAKMEYETSRYPGIKVTGEDLRTLWEDHEVAATVYYEGQSPYNVLENLLIQKADMEAAELNIPDPWTNEHTLYHQFVEMSVDDIVKELLDHFGYYPFVNVHGQFEPRYLNLEKATDHAYPSTVQMIKYTPNDEYSTFINQVIVKGISHVYYEVLYPEESITELSGTVGFWGKTITEKVWYSDDHNKTCRYPRLEILQSVASAAIFTIRVGGGSESITGTDSNEQYVTVTITAPNLLPALIAAAAAIVALGIQALTCDGFFGFGGHCGWYIFAITILLNVVCYILGSVASYSYNIWACPIGHEKRSFQATANDYPFQAEIGNKVVSTSIDDPMAYTIAICQQVADGEMEIVKAQRRRLEFRKTAHLQDEVGDILEMTHPYSRETLKIFSASIKRTMKVGKEFIDEIEGWRLS